MKHKVFILFAALLVLSQSVRAYDFSYTYQGKTLYYTIYYNNSFDAYFACVVNPSWSDFYSYVSGELIIPDSVEQNGIVYAVSGIGSNAFSNCTGLNAVIIGNSVISIGEEAFNNCAYLTSVTFPESVTYIGYRAFSGCGALTSVSIPSSVTAIGSQVFSYCSNLDTIVVEPGNICYDSRENCNAIIATNTNTLIQACNTTIIPTSVVSIGSYAFSGVSGLASVTIHDSVTSIGNYAFYDCNGMISAVIGNSVTSIGDHAFCGCSSLNSIIIPNTVTLINEYTFKGCNSLSSVIIPNSVISIGREAFRYCSSLTSVSIPNSVTNIGHFSFQECTNLSFVEIGNSVTSIGMDAFERCYNLTMVLCQSPIPPVLGTNDALGSNPNTSFYVPCNSVSSYQSSSYWSDYSSHIHGMLDLDFTYSFSSNNDTMGTVNVGLVDCDSNITVTGTANTGYQFNGWSDGGTGNPRTFHLTSDTTVTAIFDYITYIVTVQPNNATRGTVTGGDTVYYGDSVTLTATANYGYHFQRWQDNNTENPRTVVVTQNKTFTAYFQPNTYTVTVHSADSTQGSVSGSGTVNYMSNRTLHANPATGYHFSHWSDGDSSATRTITVTGDTTLTAYFVINSYQLTVLPNDSTLGTVTGSGTYTHGTQVTVNATPTIGNRFDRWSDNTLLSSYTFPLTGNLQLVAVFMPADTVFVHDTTYMDVPYPVHDTTYIDVHDTTYVDVLYPVHDTTYITVTDTLTVHDTTIVDNYIHDTTFVYDTTLVTDTIWLTEYLHDTIYLPQYIYDTVYIHDTVYVGVDDVDALNAKVYVNNGQIVVEGAEGNSVSFYDINGRLLATRRDYTPLRFDAPVSGTYMIKIGNHPARKVVVIR